MKATFGYDGTIVENPNVDTSLRLPCAIRNWGLCSKDSLLKACRLGSENIYKQLQSTGIGRGQLPIIAKLSVLGECVYVVITDTVGKGETVLAAFLDFGDEAWSLQQVAGARGSVEPRCAFSQQLIQELLGRAATKNQIDPTKISSMAASFVNPVPFSLGGKLAFRPGSETLCNIPLDSAIPAKKATKAKAHGGAARGPLGLVCQAFSDAPLTKPRLPGLDLDETGEDEDEDHMEVAKRLMWTQAQVMQAQVQAVLLIRLKTRLPRLRTPTLQTRKMQMQMRIFLSLLMSRLIQSGTLCQAAASLVSWAWTSRRLRRRSAGCVATRALTKRLVLWAKQRTDCGPCRSLARPRSPCTLAAYLILVFWQPSRIR